MNKLFVIVGLSVTTIACAASSTPVAQPDEARDSKVASASAKAETPAQKSATATKQSGCQDEALCELSGLCSPGEANECVAASSDECQASKQCGTDGACTARDGECIAATDADCKASTACTKERRCAAFEGYCVYSSLSTPAVLTETSAIEYLR